LTRTAGGLKVSHEELSLKDRLKKISERIIDHYTLSLDRNSIEYWQCFIFYVIALSGTILGTLSLLSAIIVLLPKGLLFACSIFTVLYTINVFIILSRRFSLRVKTLVIAFNFYFSGFISLTIAGPLGESGIWFSVSVLLCSLFIGFKTSLLFAMLNLLTGVTFGVLHAKGLIAWNSLRGIPFASWLLQSGNIFFVDMMFAIANAVLIRGVGATFRSLNAAEAKIHASLNEKETLIRELYHRTKNNMQVVSSLLMLHSDELESEGAKTIFKDIISKIVAMSLVHQKLYESHDLSNIDLADYIRELIALLVKSYGASSEKLEVDLDLENVTILIDTAVPCGLVVSEIIANSLKHAFPNGRSGRIEVVLKRAEDDLIELRIADDGIGLPEGFQVAGQGKMGMKTLFNMVKHQLHGSIQLSGENGLAYLIRFKGRLYDERVRSDG
jgi:two-component sensor histidine kinase